MSKSTGQGKGEGEGKGILSKLRGKGRKRSKSKPLQHHIPGIPGIPRPRSPSTTAPYTVLDQSIVTAAAANSTASTNASRADRGDDSSSAPGPSRPSQTQTQTRSPSPLVSRYVPTTPSSSLPSALATSSSFPSQAQAVGFRVVGVEPKLSSLQNTISQDPKLERMVQILPAAAGSVLEGDNDQLCVVIDDGEDKSAKAPRMSRTLDVIVCPSVWTGSGIRSLLSALNQIKHTRAVQRVYVHTLQELFAHLDQKKDERKLSERRQRGGSVSTLKSPGFVAPSHVNQGGQDLPSHTEQGTHEQQGHQDDSQPRPFWFPASPPLDQGQVSEFQQAQQQAATPHQPRATPFGALTINTSGLSAFPRYRQSSLHSHSTQPALEPRQTKTRKPAKKPRHDVAESPVADEYQPITQLFTIQQDDRNESDAESDELVSIQQSPRQLGGRRPERRDRLQRLDVNRVEVPALRMQETATEDGDDLDKYLEVLNKVPWRKGRVVIPPPRRTRKNQSSSRPVPFSSPGRHIQPGYHGTSAYSMLEVEVFDRGILADPYISNFKRFLSSHDTDDSDPDPLFERFQRIARKAATLQQSRTTIYVPTMRHVTARPGLASSRRGGLCLDSCELISMWSVSSPPPVHKLGSARLARTQSQSQLEPRAYMLARLNPLLDALANGDTGCLVVPGVILEELERHDRAILSTLLDILAAHDKHLAPRPPVIRIVLHESIAGIRHDHNVNAPVIEQVRGDAAILHTLMRWASSSTPSDNDVSRPPRLMRLVSNDYMILLRGYVLDWPSSNHVYMPRFYPPPPDARRSSTLPASKDQRPATAQQYQTFLSCRSPGQHGMALT